ncbi:hypothetical protein NQZ68_008349 [Dissostichus eleginoides]|nr:hypothetical protein NQZ68_008349 [Dissostichus eleginoides]
MRIHLKIVKQLLWEIPDICSYHEQSLTSDPLPLIRPFKAASTSRPAPQRPHEKEMVRYDWGFHPGRGDHI